MSERQPAGPVRPVQGPALGQDSPRLHPRGQAWPAGATHDQVAAAPALLDFAGAVQVAQIRRTRTIAGKKTVEVVYVITSMPSHEASPLQIAAWVQGHWSIENRLHSGPRRHLRRRPLMRANRERTPDHGQPALDRDHRPTPDRYHQHRPSHPTSRRNTARPALPSYARSTVGSRSGPDSGIWRHMTRRGQADLHRCRPELPTSPPAVPAPRGPGSPLHWPVPSRRSGLTLEFVELNDGARERMEESWVQHSRRASWRGRIIGPPHAGRQLKLDPWHPSAIHGV
jgi:hypothetical protein